MAYSGLAKALRRCRATRKDGKPSRAYATWDSPNGLCAAHGRHHTGPLPARHAPSKRTAYEPCRCQAYQWPHRPGGGLCRWPEVPEYRLLTPAGTKSMFNGGTWRIFSLGMRLNQQRLEKMWEALREAAEPEKSEAASPHPMPMLEPALSREEEIALVLASIGRRRGGGEAQ